MTALLTTSTPAMSAPTPRPVAAGVDPSAVSGQAISDAQRAAAADGNPSATADQRCVDTPDHDVGGGGPSPGEPMGSSMPKTGTARPGDVLLVVFADALDDMERTRIATENRVRSLAQVKRLDGSPEQQRMEAVVADLRLLEHRVELDLRRAMRTHPLGPWAKAQRGIGEKQAARLLAAVGDPYIDMRTGRPRTVSQLWAYCGYHVLPAGHAPIVAQGGCAGGGFSSSHPSQADGDTHAGSAGVAARRQRGRKANWNTAAKMRAYLVAESCMKAGGPYRDVYDKRRAATAERTHATDCVRCGPSGHPAPEGTPWSAGHQHTDALRVAAKAILKDLWRESKRLHEGAS